jgi:hypothetical protein
MHLNYESIEIKFTIKYYNMCSMVAVAINTMIYQIGGTFQHFIPLHCYLTLYYLSVSANQTYLLIYSSCCKFTDIYYVSRDPLCLLCAIVRN